ncbi:TlpA family protein disulfide reductase [Sphingobacterium sp. MYb388]|uniref:TlpA family protein disulfide reductase n=1 Tax=Sphingobacterium sp. MYb388 TaxID=2745437 RepID=UPI0030A09B4B
MKYFKTIILIITTIGCSININAQQKTLKDYKLLVTLENAPFDTLYLFDYTDNRNIQLPGKKKGPFTWEIIIPDSIVNNSENMILKVRDYDPINNTTTNIRFITSQNKRIIPIANIGVEDRVNYIHARYKEKTVFTGDIISTKINNKDTSIMGDLICEDFDLMLQNDNSDITIRAKDPYFSWFNNYYNEKKSYEQYLTSYKSFVKTYPDSRYLISGLASNLNNYRSVEDIKILYSLFSEKHKHTQWAKKIESFISRKFENSSLSTLDQKGHEEVIQDQSKFNLIVFTASWCAPCLEEIPLLKDIHNDLDQNLIITYISIDEQKNIPAFKKVITEHNIAWRSLLAYEDNKKIKEKYFVNGIPHCILVYPNGDMESIEIRHPDKKTRLYKIVNNNMELKYNND